MDSEGKVTEAELKEMADNMALQLNFQNVMDFRNSRNPYSEILLSELTTDNPCTTAAWKIFEADYNFRKQNFPAGFS